MSVPFLLVPLALASAPAQTFQCGDGSDLAPAFTLVLDGSVASATLAPAQGAPVTLVGTQEVEILGPGTRLTGFPLHTITLSSGANSLTLSLVEGGASLWGNGTLRLEGLAASTWIGDCEIVD